MYNIKYNSIDFYPAVISQAFMCAAGNLRNQFFQRWSLLFFFTFTMFFNGTIYSLAH